MKNAGLFALMLALGLQLCSPIPSIAEETALTPDPPQPRGRWVDALQSPPERIDPRKQSALPADLDGGLQGLPKVSVMASAHYSFGSAVGADGAVYFAEYNNRTVKKILPDGRMKSIPIKTEFYGKGGYYGIAVDHQGNLFIGLDSDSKNGGVLRISPNGQERYVIEGINRPRQMTTDSKGSLYVALEGNNTIVCWDCATGETRTVVSEAETITPEGVAVDEAGNVYFTEYGKMMGGAEDPDGRGLLAGVPREPGKLKVKRSDGSIHVLAEGYWRMRGLTRAPDGALYFTTEANAWDQSNSGLLVRVDPQGAVKTVLQGLMYPQFPSTSRDGRIYFASSIDDLLLCYDPHTQFTESSHPTQPDIQYATHGGALDFDEKASKGAAFQLHVEGIELTGRIAPAEGAQEVQAWIKIPAERLNLSQTELPYCGPHFVGPGRYEIPMTSCQMESGQCEIVAAVPLRNHCGARWPMICGYKGPEPQYHGREFPSEGFRDNPLAYLVFVRWKPAGLISSSSSGKANQ